MYRKIHGGNHLRVIRNWMQRNANNGNRVTWGTNETLEGVHITVNDMERLAQDIYDAVCEDVRDKVIRHAQTELSHITFPDIWRKIKEN